mgnify:CR=1 FL=1
MRILAITCNQCGTPLEVPEETRYLTCTACFSQLEVHCSGNATYTEVLEATEAIEAMQQRTDQVASNIASRTQTREPTCFPHSTPYNDLLVEKEHFERSSRQKLIPSRRMTR